MGMLQCVWLLKKNLGGKTGDQYFLPFLTGTLSFHSAAVQQHSGQEHSIDIQAIVFKGTFSLGRPTDY